MTPRRSSKRMPSKRRACSQDQKETLLTTPYREQWVGPRPSWWACNRRKVALVAAGAIGLLGIHHGLLPQSEFFQLNTSSNDDAGIGLPKVVSILSWRVSEKGQAIIATIATKAKKAKTDKEWWAARAQEHKKCAPFYFVKKELVAHYLFLVTCLDKKGKYHKKYIKSIWVRDSSKTPYHYSP